jgi:hypothetical protein
LRYRIADRDRLPQQRGRERQARTRRLKVELADRLRRCGEITETFPGQFMTPALKLLLTRLELNLNQRQLAWTSTAPNSRRASPNWKA